MPLPCAGNIWHAASPTSATPGAVRRAYGRRSGMSPAPPYSASPIHRWRARTQRHQRRAGAPLALAERPGEHRHTVQVVAHGDRDQREPAGEAQEATRCRPAARRERPGTTPRPPASATSWSYCAAEHSPPASPRGMHVRAPAPVAAQGRGGRSASTNNAASIRTAPSSAVLQRTARTRSPRELHAHVAHLVDHLDAQLPGVVEQVGAQRPHVGVVHRVVGEHEAGPVGPDHHGAAAAARQSPGNSMPARSKCQRTTPLSHRAPR